MKHIVWLLLFCTQWLCAQKEGYPAWSIPKELKENVNAVVRDESIEIEVVSQERYVEKSSSAVTALNETGFNAIQNFLHYSPKDKIKKAEVFVYDANGKQLKKIAQKDFNDQAYSQIGGSISDDRLLTFRYQPLAYPVTVLFNYEVEKRSTAFIPGYFPIQSSYVAVERSRYRITAPAELGLEAKPLNLHYIPELKESVLPNGWAFEVNQFAGIADESYAPRSEELIPKVMFRLKRFELEGVKGEVNDWNSFGKWIYDKMLATTSEIPPSLKTELESLVANASTDIEKARIVYNYMQARSRYVAIMLGIGGWKPLSVETVHKLGYGDCKALTNYMRVMLKAVGVESYYTILHSSGSPRSLISDFASVQGNHVILAMPQGDEYLFIECTSQHLPFGYMLDDNADRQVLVVKPEGGELVRTPEQNGSRSLFQLEGKASISADGIIQADFSTLNTGDFYEGRFRLDLMKESDRMEALREELSHLRQLTIEKYRAENQSEKGEFNEHFSIRAEKVGDASGNRILLPVQFLYRQTAVPTRHRNRTLPMEILDSFEIRQTYTVQLPEGYQVEAKPDDVAFESPFGSYQLQVKEVQADLLEVQHVYTVQKGSHPKEAYEQFRKFKEEVVKRDQSKIAIIKT